MGEDSTAETWQVAKVTGIGVGELWFDAVETGLSQNSAERKAQREESHIAIPENELPDDWGQQWLDGDLEDDPYA